MTGYLINKDVESEAPSSKFMPPTIEAGRFVTNIELNTEDPEKVYLLIEMEDSKGLTVSRRYFEPSIDGSYTKNEEDLKKAIDKTVKVFANLARKFLGDEYETKFNPANPNDPDSKPEPATFVNFCKHLVADIGDKYKGVELRTKVILNTANFPTLPSYAPIWEDPSKVSEKNSKLSYGSYDKINQSVVAADTDAPSSVKEPGW